MNKILITEEAISSYSVCPRKSYQVLFNYPEGNKQKYAVLMHKRIEDSENEFFKSKTHKDFDPLNLSDDVDCIRNAKYNIGNLAVRKTHLIKQKVNPKLESKLYEPLIFVPSNKVNPEDRIKALFIGHILYKVQGHIPQKATFIFFDGATKTIRLDNNIYQPILSELLEWIDLRPEIPAITFNKHCSTCPFEERCVNEAEKTDSISLLSRMPPRVQKKFESKGIFTIKQLSFLFKHKRKRSRFRGETKPVHKYELQALAIRTRKIYTTDLIPLPQNDVELFVDIESLPEQRFHYLIGLYVCSPSGQNYYSMWSETKEDEKNNWLNIVGILNRYPDAPIFHYGNYENKVFKELAKRYSTNIEEINNRLNNLNEYVYGRIYFPTYNNNLKSICNYLGYKWTDENASGLNSIVLRSAYDITQKQVFHDDLVLYNKEDCVNLKKLKDTLGAVCSHVEITPDVMDVNSEKQLLNESGTKLLKEFDDLLKSAHGKYEYSKIALNKRKKIKTFTKKKEIKKYLFRILIRT